ncbi:ISAs1 family transposase [Nonomuraea sp. NPDC000554]|uniref:ISAs1 family transposase n=1 Tax=Nonomuraea sp. NPDC000554 TaxID=3154259 RepID=UPI0033175B6B
MAKALRGARHHRGEPVHLLAAFDHGSGLVLAQTDVPGKTNEITRFQPLLGRLDLHDRVVTADTLHTQREHATFLIERKRAHYVLIVKKNQPSLYAQVSRGRRRPVARRTPARPGRHAAGRPRAAGGLARPRRRCPALRP